MSKALDLAESIGETLVVIPSPKIQLAGSKESTKRTSGEGSTTMRIRTNERTVVHLGTQTDDKDSGMVSTFESITVYDSRTNGKRMISGR